MPDLKKLEDIAKLSDIKRMFFTGNAVYTGDSFIDVARVKIGLKGIKDIFIERHFLSQSVKSSYMDAKLQIDEVLDMVFESEKPYRVACNLKDENFILRRFSMAEIPTGELRNAVFYEVQKYVHYAIEELRYDFRICSKEKGYQEIMFAASESKNIDDIVSYFSEKNILPSVIESTPILLSRILSLENGIDKEEEYIILHYEPKDKIIITGIWRGYPYFFRDIRLSLGVLSQDGTNYPSLKDVWGEIENTLSSTVDYLRKETKQNISSIFVSGFTYSEGEKKISQEFGILFRRFELPHFHYVRVENRDRFLPCIALLYDSIHKPYVNLTHKEIIEKDPWFFKPVLLFASTILGMILSVHFLLAFMNADISNRTNRIKREIDSYNIISSSASKDKIMFLKNTMEEKLNFLDEMITKKIYLTEKLTRISGNLTDRSWIGGIEFYNVIEEKKKILKIKGALYVPQGEDVTELNDILRNIKSDKVLMSGFRDMELVSAKRGKLMDKEISDFEIILRGGKKNEI